MKLKKIEKEKNERMGRGARLGGVEESWETGDESKNETGPGAQQQKEYSLLVVSSTMTSEWSVPVPVNPGLHNSSSLNCSWFEAISSADAHIDAQRVAVACTYGTTRTAACWMLEDTEIA